MLAAIKKDVKDVSVPLKNSSVLGLLSDRIEGGHDIYGDVCELMKIIEDGFFLWEQRFVLIVIEVLKKLFRVFETPSFRGMCVSGDFHLVELCSHLIELFFSEESSFNIVVPALISFLILYLGKERFLSYATLFPALIMIDGSQRNSELAEALRSGCEDASIGDIASMDRYDILLRQNDVSFMGCEGVPCAKTHAIEGLTVGDLISGNAIIDYFREQQIPI